MNRALLIARRWFGLAAIALLLPGTPARGQPTPLVLQTKIGGGLEGSIVMNGEGSFTVMGGGTDIWDASDGFTFHYLEVSGDFDAQVRVELFEPAARWAKAGLMARESVAPDSRMAYAYVEPPAVPVWFGGGVGENDAVFGYRTGIPGAGLNGGQHGDPATGRPAAGYPNAWLRLRRVGHQVTAYHGTTGSNWTQLGTQDTALWQSNGVATPLPPNLLLGLAATKQNLSSPLVRVEFRDFQILNSPPQVLEQPASLTVEEARDAAFTVSAEGPGPLAYQWRFNGSPLPDATNAALFLAGVQLAQAGSYTVTITNGSGSITSAPAALTVLVDTNPPTVLAVRPSLNLTNVTLRFSERLLPSTVTVLSNYASEAGFSVLSAALDAGGSDVLLVTTPLTIGASYTLRLYGLRDRAPAQNEIVPGTVVTFRAARLVTGKLRIDYFDNIPGNSVAHLTNQARFPDAPDEVRMLASFQPAADRGNNYGARVWGYFVPPTNGHYTFYLRSDDASQLFVSADADAFGKVLLAREDSCCNSYGVWDRSGTASNLVAGQFYYMECLWKEATGGDYLFVAATAAGAPVPNDLEVIPPAQLAVLTDLYPPFITLPPQSQTVIAGSPVTFTVAADGAAPLAWQWRFYGTNLPGQTNATLTLSNVQAADAGSYTVRVQNPDGSALSDPALLTVIVPPQITAQPQSVFAAVGSNAMFSVTVAGSTPFTRQWFFNGAPLPGATAASLLLTNVQMTNAGAYRVHLTYEAGVITSAVATLTVYTNYGRFLRVASTNAMAGASVAVPVHLSAQGDENGAGFSLGFDPSVMTFVSATNGGGVPGATLSLNTNQLAAGRVGLSLILSPGTTFTAGTQEVMVIQFTISASSGDLLVPLPFLDQPTLREVTDALAEPLATVYLNGSLNIGGGIEGDVTPPPNGNGVVTATDWVKIGRYSTGADTPPPGVQFQRADCAPRSTAGGGTFSVGDWVQAGRYVAALDPPTPVGGPSAPPGGFAPADFGGFAADGAGMFQPASANRIVRMTGLNAQPGQTFQTSLLLESCGDESALSLSLAFDRQWLEFAGFTPGTNAAGATLNVNSSQSGTGRLGIGFSLPVGGSFATGTRELVRLTFHAATNATGVTAVAFSDQPVVREISDALANALVTTYVSGSISIGPEPPAPLRLQPPQRQPAGHYRLLVGNADGSAIVSNRLSQIEVRATADLGLAFSNWTRLTNAPALTNGLLQLDDLGATNFPRRFYRVVEQP